MYYRDLNIFDYELIWAYRPIYNNSDELYPIDKKVRKFLVLKNLDDDKLLVLSISSKEHFKYHYKIGKNSYAVLNNLYIISKKDIVKRENILPNDIIDIVLKKCLDCINENTISYNDEIKKIFLNLCKEYFTQKPKGTFNRRDIIYLPDLPDKKYIVDDFRKYAYWAYRIVSDKENNEGNYKIDFSSRIMLEKNKNYLLYDSIDLEVYKFLKEKSLNKLRQEKNQSNNLYHKFDIETGGIIKYDDKEYFVVFITGTGKYLCIPYQGNYLLDKIVTIDKNKVKFIKYLANSEIIEILNTLYSNINIQIDNKLQNKLYMKILDYK